MTLSIQFHATAEEIEPLVLKWLGDRDLSAAELTRRPFTVKAADAASLAGRIARGSVEWIALANRKLDLQANSHNQFFDKNPDVMNIEIGKRDSESLGESGLSSMAAGSTLLRWQKLAKSLKAITKAGAIAVNPKTGETGRIKNHRYSAGAAELEKRGVKMLPIAGIAIYRFPDE